MSRLAGILLVVLTATSFAAPPSTPKEAKTEDVATAKSSKFPLRVVKVLTDSDQALLFDKTRGRHVLVEVGESVGDYIISSIEEDEVTVTGKDIPVEVVLAVPETRKQRQALRKAAKDAKDAAEAEKGTAHEATPVAATDAAPSDPYGDAEPRELSADDDETPAPAEPLIRATPWGDEKVGSKTDGNKSTTSPFANMDANAAKPTEDVANAGKPVEAKPAKSAKAATPVPAETTPPVTTPPVTTPAVEGPTKISKKEVAAALNDFGKLATAIDGSFGATGLTLNKVLAGSVFAKAGLLAGDVVTSVNNKPLRTIDDAADLYARAGGMKSATVQLVRAGKPQTIRISIQ